MQNKEGGFKSLTPIIQSLIWVILLLLAVMLKWMSDNNYYCFDERVCNKPYLNILK